MKQSNVFHLTEEEERQALLEYLVKRRPSALMTPEALREARIYHRSLARDNNTAITIELPAEEVK